MKDGKRKDPPNLHILKLTFTFFSTGMILFLAAMIAAAWFIPELVQVQSLRGPKGWFLAHMFLLGFATTIAMGASFQITQVIMRTSLFSRRMGYIQYGFYMLGFFGLLGGFLADVKLIAAGGWCLLAGCVLYAINLAATFFRKKEWNLFVFGVSLCLLELLIVIFLGIAMGLGFAFGWTGTYHGAIFGSHLWFGIGGWLSGLILVYSFKLLPMFYVSRKKLTISAYWILGLYHLGVWLQVVSLWCGLQWIAAAASILMLIAVGWFIVHIFDVRRQSRGKQPIGAVKAAFFLIPAFGLLFFIWSGLQWAGLGIPKVHEALVISVILGWFAPTILSYLSKILPFLWWSHRFRTKEEKKSAVLLSEMLPENRMTWELYGYLAGIGAVVAGYMLQLPMTALFGQLAAIVFACIYLAELLRVFRY